MKNSLTLATAATALVALLSGCGGSSSTSTSSSAAASPGTTASTAAGVGERYGAARSKAPASASTAAGVALATKHDKVGTVLAAGPKRLTVYLFEGDHGRVSSCTGACASAWPPVTTQSAPMASAGVIPADVGTITRSDGTRQVTYNGHPLYFFVKDRDRGDAYGQGVKAFGASWYVMAPSGNKIDRS